MERYVDWPVAVIGAGLTGTSWAGLFAANGLSVRLYDTDETKIATASAGVARTVGFLVEHGLADADAAQRGLAGLRGHTDSEEAFADVRFVQECVVENLEAKRSVFALASRLAASDALLASSSSGISISEIQTAAVRPECCLGAHPYNPPHLIPLVELSPGDVTAEETMARASDFYRSIGKDPVALKRDVPGYIGNRLSVALWREAIELVRSGVATVDDIDRVVFNGPGLRWAVMGPHLLYHLGGGRGGIRGHLEHLGWVKERMLGEIADWKTFPEDAASVLEDGLRWAHEEEVSDDLVTRRDEALAALLALRSRVAGEH